MSKFVTENGRNTIITYIITIGGLIVNPISNHYINGLVCINIVI